MLYALKEFARLLLLLFVASFLTFSLLYVSPGDAAELILLAHDMMPSEEALAAIRQEYGLDKPFLLRYFDWLMGVMQGDFGYSHSAGRPVGEEFMRKIPPTLMLATFSIAILLFFSFLLGIVAAMHKGRITDYIIMFFASSVIAVPSFWMGLMLILLFVVQLGWFQITRMHEPQNMILAATALALPLIGRYASLIRAGIVEQLSLDYVKGAKVRGIAPLTIFTRHLLPNTIIIVLPPLGISIGAILGGTIIIEEVFAIPGLGRMVLDAINLRDFPLIQSFVMFMTVIYIGIGFIIDQICKALDPRMRFESGAK